MSEFTRRGFIKLAGMAAAAVALPGYVSAANGKKTNNMNQKAVPGTGGNHYVPYDQRTFPSSLSISPATFQLRDLSKSLTV